MDNTTEKIIQVVAKKYTTLPTDQVNMASAAVFVAANWQNKAEFANLSLSQITPADFVILATRLSDNISKKRDILGNYSQQTKAVRDLFADINQNSKVLKGYLFEEYKTKAKDHYSAFGFARKGTSFVMPNDYDNVAQTLRTICDKINSPAYNFLQNKTYGKTYWETNRDTFQTSWTSSRQQASNLTSLTKLINDDFTAVKKIMTLLRRRIKDDFSPNHEAAYRSIGMLKESF